LDSAYEAMTNGGTNKNVGRAIGPGAGGGAAIDAGAGFGHCC
jgi:hypothetical protein